MAAEDFLLKLDETLAGTYRIVRFIGKGGMGEVYEAVHARLAGRYAVKLLLQEIGRNEDVLKRFKQEAEVTSRLRHPNIVHVIDFDRMTDGTPYMVMELLEGRDLADELRAVGPLPLTRVVSIVDQVASGLAAAHAENVVHRDLKPANLFLTPLRGGSRELVKIVDFGISKVLALVTGGLTRTQAIIGTPQYMAPEQARGARDLDNRTDQFALATITWEMLTGTPPFQADEVPAILYQIVHEPAPSLQSQGFHGLGPVDEVIQRAMSKDPAARYPQITDFAQALLEASLRCPGSGAGALAMSGRRAHAGFPTPMPTQPAVSVTTLRASSGQVTPAADTTLPSPRPSRKGLWLTLAVLGAAAAAAGVVVWSRSDAKDAPGAMGGTAAAEGSAAQAPVVAAEPAEITIDLSGVPDGALIKVDGEEQTPPLRLPRDRRRHQLVVAAPGYRSREQWISATRDLNLPMPLQKETLPVTHEPPLAEAHAQPAGAAHAAPPSRGTHHARPKKPSNNLVNDL